MLGHKKSIKKHHFNCWYLMAYTDSIAVRPVLKGIKYTSTNPRLQRPRPIAQKTNHVCADSMKYDFDFASVLTSWPQFLEGAGMTILLSFPATVIGFVGGTLLAIGRRGDRRWVARACGVYVEVLRNTPLLVQVFLVFFGLASLGWKVSAFSAALLSLVINVAAYSC
jgi:His/Glu/Gln/Arg/opine family amino acid ABC transporter permease subunit